MHARLTKEMLVIIQLHLKLYFEDRGGQNAYVFGLGGGSSNWNDAGDNNNFNGTYNKWDHVVCTITGTAMKVFVNGSAGGTDTFSGTRQTNAVPLRIGGIYSLEHY